MKLKMIREVTNETKTCPFCKDDRFRGLMAYEFKWAHRFFVKCEGCAAMGPPMPLKEDAIKAWNTRPAAPDNNSMNPTRLDAADFDGLMEPDVDTPFDGFP